MLWIALHLPALSLESFAATLDNTQSTRPAALLEAHHIVQADAAAQALGVRPGMKRATALALVPDLVLGQADALRDAQALLAVAHAALAFTPAVALDALGVRLEVQSSLRYFGGLTALIERLQAALQPLGHAVQWATAPTAMGAALLARWRADSRATAPSLPALRDMLDAAPVWLLGPGREHWQALQGMGLRTLADLRALPRSGLARRFGPELLLDLDRARGDAPEPHTWVLLPARFEQRLELYTRADRSEQVIAGARILLARLVAWAQAQHGRIAHFTLRMHHERHRRHREVDAAVAGAVDAAAAPATSPADATAVAAAATAPWLTPLDIALALPAIDLAHLQMLLVERLERTPMAAPTLELSLLCDAVVPGEAPNAELFPTRASAQAGLARLIERLQARLGREQVRCIEPVAEHRPERATRWHPADAALAGRQGGQRRAAGAAVFADATPPLLTRPVWLWPQAQPLHERGSHPVLDGRPLQLLAGPERIESGWWDGALAARDYFIAAAADGALVWIYRARLPLAPDDAGEGWFLHGRFA